MSLTIMEAIDNLKKSSGGGNEFVLNLSYNEELDRSVVDKTYDEIVIAIKSGLKPVIISNEYDTNFPDFSAQYRYEYCHSSLGLPSSDSSVNGISFINFAPSLGRVGGELIASVDVTAIVIGEDNLLYFITARFDSVTLDD